jgi:hypothetical protein
VGTIEVGRRLRSSTRWVVLIPLAAACAWASAGCGPAQIGEDQGAFKAVDALYTAVSLRDERLLAQCEKTLGELVASGQLPEAAAGSLDAIVAEAKGGHWESAQAHLGDFMRGQRR